jgi:hydrogenase maturation protease
MNLVVFGWGNISRGDDAIGPLLLARIAQARWSDAVLIEDYQLQLEHALDLQGADLALFLDAGRNTPAPFAFREVFPREDMSHSSHALEPEAVLSVYEKALNALAPPSFLLCVRGENFGLGEALSIEGSERLDQAWRFLERLNATRNPNCWRERLTEM